MTEHSVTDNIDHMPNWDDNLIFAEELNECMLAGCTGYIYWYLRAHWAFAGTGQPWEHNGQSINFPENKKDELLPRAFVMSHFSKNVTGSTSLKTSQDETEGRTKEEIPANYEFSAYSKGDSIIVMAINATDNPRDLKITLPYPVYCGTHLLSTGNETENLCQETPIDIEGPTKVVTVEMPARSLNTYIFMIDQGILAVEEVKEKPVTGSTVYYDLQGRRLDEPHGLCIERQPNGISRKIHFR